MKILLTLIALAAPISAMADSPISTKLSAFVEKTVHDANGTKLVLEDRKQIFPGEKVVYVLSYHNSGQAAVSNFAITDAVPGPISFESTPDATALVSVDGGKSWGSLSTLKVAVGSGFRAARPEDVTHVRWALKTAIPAGAEGKLSFRGTVK